MGDTRFKLGFLKGLVAMKPHRCRLKLKIEEDDKIHMAREVRVKVAEALEKKVVGGGSDPLAGSSKDKGTSVEPNDGSPLNGHAGASTSSTSGGTLIEPNGAANGSDDADPSLPEAKQMQPDDTWRTIESGVKSKNARPQHDLIAKNNPNEWDDNQDLLYFK